MVIIQARMGSTRFPGKVLKPVLERPLLHYVVERCRLAVLVDEVVVCTTEQIQDQAIADFCKKESVCCIRGDEEDVLSRYVKAAKEVKADVIVRITADCPLVDPAIIDKALKLYTNSSFDYVSNCIVRTYPRGFDVEVFSNSSLIKAQEAASSFEEKEHVTLHFLRNPDKFFIGNFLAKEDCSAFRVTVDTQEDFILIEHVLSALYPHRPKFTYEEVVQLLIERPDLVKINAHIEQKKVLHE